MCHQCGEHSSSKEQEAQLSDIHQYGEMEFKVMTMAQNHHTSDLGGAN